MSKERRPAQNNSEEYFGYAFIAVFVFALYVSIIGIYLNFNRTVIPTGDPFTYTGGFFSLLDKAHSNLHEAFKVAFTENWYWLINTMIVIFSPVIVKEPFSLSLVNFLMWGLATASFFRLARCLKCSVGFSFIVSWLIWLFPINYGFLDHTSISVMGLDAMFMGVLNVAIANTLIFALEPQKIKNALLAGLAVGFAIWGRGNSIAVVLLVVFIPLLFLVFKMCKKIKERMVVVNFFIFSVISLAMSAYYYIKMWAPLKNYYTGHLEFAQRHHFNMKDVMPFIKNIPGFFFWRFENSLATISISLFSHLIILLSLYLSFRCNLEDADKKPLKLLSLTGAFIYFGTYFINIIFFTDPILNIYNCLLIYAPMRIGMALCMFSILAYFVMAKKIYIKQWVVYPMTVLAIIYGFCITKIQTPPPNCDGPTPVEIESFAKNMDSFLDGGSISFLWYGYYNQNILRYYRRKNDLPDYRLYTNEYTDDIWQQYFHTEEKRKKVRDGIRKYFENSSFIVIPEYIDSYNPDSPYSFCVFKDEISRYLNSPDSPRFVIRMTLRESSGNRLLVLQKGVSGLGVPLKLPYGPRPVAAVPPQAVAVSESKAVVIEPKPEKKVEVLDSRPRQIFVPLSRPAVSLKNVKVTVSGKSDLYLYPRAFDNAIDPNSFWEATGKYPFWVELEYPKKVKIKKYFLAAGECTIRMPNRWQLQGADNGLAWLTLDARDKETQWGADEKRKYVIANPKEYKFYRLYFTAGGIYDIFRIYEIGLEE